MIDYYWAVHPIVSWIPNFEFQIRMASSKAAEPKNTFIWWKLGIGDLEFVKKCGETKNYLEHSNSSVSSSPS